MVFQQCYYNHVSKKVFSSLNYNFFKLVLFVCVQIIALLKTPVKYFLKLFFIFLSLPFCQFVAVHNRIILLFYYTFNIFLKNFKKVREAFPSQGQIVLLGVTLSADPKFLKFRHEAFSNNFIIPHKLFSIWKVLMVCGFVFSLFLKRAWLKI